MIICSFLIPVILWAFAMFVSGVYIGGENTLFVSDMLYQYAGFFEFYKSVLKEGSNIIYSFAYGLGGETLSLFAYYLASPFNLVLSFLEVPEAVYVINLLKIGCSGLTFYIFLSKKFNKKDWINIAFSTCYALMGYNVVYQLNLMWLDGVIWLPIVILGIDRIYEKNKPLLFYISLTISIISNWYIGYMLCLASGVYAIYLLFPNFKENYKKFFKFILFGILSAGTSGIVLIPEIYAQLQSFSRIEYVLDAISKVNFPIFDIFQKFVMGSFNFGQITNETYGLFTNLPNLYCGIFIAFLCVVYFCNKNISILERRKDGILLLFFLFSCVFNVLNIVWHVFSVNIWFPYRWSFIICFFLIIIAYKSYLELKDLNCKNILKIGLILIFSCFVVEKMSCSYLDNGSIYLSILFLVAYIFIFIRFREKKLFKFTIIFIVCFEMLTNAIIVFKHFSYYELSENIENNKAIVDAINNINLRDKGYYRINTWNNKTWTYPFGKNILNASISGSTQKESGINLLRDLGINSEGELNILYKYTTKFNDDILGVKYYIGENAQKFYEKTELGDKIWTNSNALSLGFMCDEGIKGVSFSNDPFINQNVIGNKMSNINAKMFNEIDVNLTKYDSYLDEDKKESIYSKNKEFEFNFVAPNNKEVYLNINGAEVDVIKIYVNGKEILKEDNLYDFHIVNLGSFTENELINVEIELSTDTEIYDTQVYWFDDEIYSQIIDELKKNQLEIFEMSNSRLKGKINVEETKEILLFSILYDDFLKIKVDGKEFETLKLLDSLIGVELSPGEHIIELWYEPTLLKVSALVSVGFVIVSCLIIFLCFKKES